MNSAYKLLPHYTYADYCRWEGQWELIEGIPHAMSPAPRPEHQAVASNIAAEFRSALRKDHCSCKVYQPIDYKIAEDTVLNPDILIVCKPIQKAFLDFPPDLVVEILSPATMMKDRHTKLHLYQQQQIKWYLIVDVETQVVEVYELDSGGFYQRQDVDLRKPFSFTLSNCSIPVTLGNIWS